HGRGRAVGVGGRLAGDEVAGADEELEPEVEALHPPGGDEQAVEVALLFGRDLVRGRQIVVEGLEQDRLALGLPVGEVRRVEDLSGDASEVLGRQHVRGGRAHTELDYVVVVGGQQCGGGVDDGSDELVGTAGERQRG